jgi:predicted ABC-type ATPase
MSGESKNENGVAESALGVVAAVPKNKNKTYAFLGDLTPEQGEAIFTKGKRYAALPSPEQPTFVLLIGTPGSGKSTALARLPELVGLNPDDAVQISLDSLIESLEPFRAKTAAIATTMLEERGLPLRNNLPENVVSNIAGKTSGPYLSLMKAKKNNRPNTLGKPLAMSLNEMRFALLEKALAEGKNIIYERTISDSKKDTLREEVFERIRASGRPYKIYVVYTKIDDPTVLRERLRKRPLAMMERNPPFFRGVPAVLADKFIANHEEYFRRFLLPLEGEGVQLVVVFWDGRPDLFIPARAPATPEAENAPKTNKTANALGGARKRKTCRHQKKKRITRRKRTRRS